MPITIQIPTPMREQADGQADVAVEAGTVQSALAELVAKHPALEPKLFNNGTLRPFINVFVNDEDIRYLDEMETKIQAGQTLAIIPAVAGG